MTATMTWQHRSFAIAILLLLAACTDGRPPLTFGAESGLPASGPLLPVASVQFGGQNTAVSQMQTAFGSLFLTGTPFVAARWDITANPESPVQDYAASDNVQQFSPDPPFGAWIVSEFGSSGMGIFGNFMLTSGNFGSSLIQIGPSALNEQEVGRYPMPTANGQPADVAFEFTAIVPIPGTNTVYGFTQQDGAYSIDVSNLPNLTPGAMAPYSSQGPVCCVTGAALFANQLFLAMRNQIWVFSIAITANPLTGVPIPTLTRLGTIATLNPVGIFATSQYLYVNHEPISGATPSQQPGIYVYNNTLNEVNYFPVQPFTFAVSADDSHVYTNEDDMSVRIYRVQ